MLTNLLPMGAAMSGQNIASNTDKYSASPDNSYDPLGTFGSLGGGLLGGGIGYLTGKGLVNRAQLGTAARPMSAKEIARFKKLVPKHGSAGALKKLGFGTAVNTGASTSKLAAGKGGLMKLVAENPKLAMGGGAAIGAMLGSQMLGNAMTHDRHEKTATQMQSLAQQDAMNQQKNLMALQQPYQVRF